jgi:O-antigen/teichoic acid export membrane protein
MNLGQSIRSGAKWLLIGTFGTRFMEFAFGVILARLLVPADFGMIITIQVFTGFVSMLASGGMGQSLIRAKTADENDFNAIFTLQLAVGVLVYLLFFVSAPWIARYFDNPLYTDLIRVSTLVFLMRPFTMMRISWLNREMKYKNRSLMDIYLGLLGGVASTLMAWAGLGVWSLTLSGLLGAAAKNVVLARITPLKLRFHPDFALMKKHSAYGFKITANDFLSYLTREGKNLVLSKLAGPAFLGLFNKSESLSRLPNQLFMSSTVQPVFRAMSKVQDDLDQTKYLFYRMITLLMVYTLPFYVGLWWVAEPFIAVVYGEKWLAAAEPMGILLLSGVFLNIMHPCAVLLDAQNRLTQEMYALILRLILTLGACLIGIKWGLVGVAWGIFATHIFSAAYYYVLVLRAIPTRPAELFAAILPGLILSTLLCMTLAGVHLALDDIRISQPALYLSLMILAGPPAYLIAFLFLPIPAISDEARRWRTLLQASLRRTPKTLT